MNKVAKLTELELIQFELCDNKTDWNILVDQVIKDRDGFTPPDWHKVINLCNLSSHQSNLSK